MQMRFIVDLTQSISVDIQTVDQSSSKPGIILRTTRPNVGTKITPLPLELQSSISAKLQWYAGELISELLSTSLGVVIPVGKDPVESVTPALSDGTLSESVESVTRWVPTPPPLTVPCSDPDDIPF